MKFLFLFHIICIYLFFSTTIWADIVYLKDGSSIEGHYLDSNNDWLSLDNFEKIIRIPTKDIESVAVGFSGAKICIQFKENSDLDCTKQLNFISTRTVVILEGKGHLEAVKYSPSDLYSIQWKYQKNSPSIGKYLREGIFVTISWKESKLQGTFLKSENGSLLILNQNRTINIPESEISVLEISRNQTSSLAILPILIPGLPQFMSGNKVMGSSLMGLGFIMGLGSFTEFQKAKSLAAQSSTRVIPTNSEQIWIYKNPSNHSKADIHLKNSHILAGLFSLVYIYHFLDLYNFTNDPQLTKHQTIHRENERNQNTKIYFINSFHHSIQSQFLSSDSQYFSWEIQF